jgi:ABC-2 type transport system permease protein
MEITDQSTLPAGASRGLSRPVSPGVIVLATIRKNLQITRRYLPNLAGNLIEIAIRAVFFLLFSNTISLNTGAAGGAALSGRGLFLFLLSSLALFVFTRSTLWGPINAVTNDLYNGTLEYLYSSPGSRYAYYIGVVLSEVIISQAVFIPVLIALVTLSGMDLATALLVVLACVVVLISLTAMGIMIALLALLWRQVNSIASVLGILFEMLAGAYLPVSAFPIYLRYLAYLLPFTWGYDLLRYYSLTSPGAGSSWQTILPVWQEWLVLIVFACVFTAVSRSLLARAEKMARRQGLHII